MTQHQSQRPTGDASYDQVPYTSYPYRETHPRKLQGVGRLYGLDAPDIRTCRVLELGCAGGGNLVPMGEQLPEATLLGVDYSAVQVAKAREFAAGAGVTNVEFRHASIADLGPDAGQFDYVLCHGVFSWVHRPLQDHIFRICQQLLSPSGMAFISFNTLPGWHNRQWVREAMLFHTAGIDDPTRRVAAGKDFMRLLASSPLAKSHHAATLKEEFGRIEGRLEDYVTHEYLEDANEPMYFEEFMRRASGYGLQYVADGRVNGTPAEESWPPAKALLDATGEDVVRREQYADFLRNRSFRRAILCRSDATLDRRGTEGRLGGMYATGQLRETGRSAEGRVIFAAAGGGTFWSADPDVIEAVRRVMNAHPGALAVNELGKEGVKREILKMWEANLVELYEWPVQIGDTPATDRPRASATAKYLAGQGFPPTNRRHEVVMLNDEQRKLLLACDGSRPRLELAQATGLTDQRLGEVLAQLTRLALLTP